MIPLYLNHDFQGSLEQWARYNLPRDLPTFTNIWSFRSNRVCGWFAAQFTCPVCRGRTFAPWIWQPGLDFQRKSSCLKHQRIKGWIFPEKKKTKIPQNVGFGHVFPIAKSCEIRVKSAWAMFFRASKEIQTPGFTFSWTRPPAISDAQQGGLGFFQWRAKIF